MKNKDRFGSFEEAQRSFEAFCTKEKEKRFEEIGYHTCGSCPLVGKKGGCFNNWLFSEV